MAKYRVLLKPLHRRCGLDKKWYIQDEQSQCEEGHENREFNADLVKMMDDKTLVMGFSPGHNVRVVNGFGTNKHRKYNDKIANKTKNPEFWSIRKIQHPNTKPQFEITEKFDLILTANINNVISINGKPPFNISDLPIDNVDFSENWSINNISDLLEE